MQKFTLSPEEKKSLPADCGKKRYHGRKPPVEVDVVFQRKLWQEGGPMSAPE